MMLDSDVSSIPPSLKRPHNSDEELPLSTYETTAQDASAEPRNMAGSKRVAAVIQEIEQLQVSDQEIERLLFLPLHTEDLGRLPVYEPFDFDAIFYPDAFAAGPEQTSLLDVPLSDSRLACFIECLLLTPSPDPGLDASFDMRFVISVAMFELLTNDASWVNWNNCDPKQ
jgi:hypothetical protein